VRFLIRIGIKSKVCVVVLVRRAIVRLIALVFNRVEIVRIGRVLKRIDEFLVPAGQLDPCDTGANFEHIIGVVFDLYISVPHFSRWPECCDKLALSGIGIDFDRDVE